MSLIQNLNLLQQVPDRRTREDILRVYFGIIPCDGKVRSISNLLENQEKYGKMAERLEKERDKGRK